MKIIIAGNGKLGNTLTKKLSAEGHDVTLIDNKQSVLESTIETYDVMTVCGNCASMSVLKQAEIDKAELLIAATDADEVNLLCCFTAHSINPNIHTIARVRNPEYYEQVYAMRDAFALSMMVNPERQTAVEIERLLKYPGFLKRDTFAKGRVELVEIKVDKDSRLNNVALSDLNGIVRCKVLVFAVKREDKIITPKGNFVLKENAHIYVTAPSDTLTVLLKNLGIITHKVKKVIVCGGGRVGFYLAENLIRNGISVKIVERNYDKCVELAKLLPEANVVCGDASNQQLLAGEGIDDCDALVTMTGLDEMNMIISLYGINCKVPKVITKIGYDEQLALCDRLGLGSVVCPKKLSCDSIVRYVRAMQNKTGAAHSVHAIADGMAEALEFRIDEKTMHCGEPFKTLKIKSNVLIVCITHGAHTEIPNGDSFFNRGDTVIVVTNGDTVIHQFNDIFL